MYVVKLFFLFTLSKLGTWSAYNPVKHHAHTTLININWIYYIKLPVLVSQKADSDLGNWGKQGGKMGITVHKCSLKIASFQEALIWRNPDPSHCGDNDPLGMVWGKGQEEVRYNKLSISARLGFPHREKQSIICIFATWAFLFHAFLLTKISYS